MFIFSEENDLADRGAQTSSKAEDGPRKRGGDRKRQEVIDLLDANEKKKSRKFENPARSVY